MSGDGFRAGISLSLPSTQDAVEAQDMELSDTEEEPIKPALPLGSHTRRPIPGGRGPDYAALPARYQDRSLDRRSYHTGRMLLIKIVLKREHVF